MPLIPKYTILFILIVLWYLNIFSYSGKTANGLIVGFALSIIIILIHSLVRCKSYEVKFVIPKLHLIVVFLNIVLLVLIDTGYIKEV